MPSAYSTSKFDVRITSADGCKVPSDILRFQPKQVLKPEQWQNVVLFKHRSNSVIRRRNTRWMCRNQVSTVVTHPLSLGCVCQKLENHSVVCASKEQVHVFLVVQVTNHCLKLIIQNLH